MTLQGSEGTTRRAVAFAYDDAATPLNPDKFYFDGIHVVAGQLDTNGGVGTSRAQSISKNPPPATITTRGAVSPVHGDPTAAATQGRAPPPPLSTLLPRLPSVITRRPVSHPTEGWADGGACPVLLDAPSRTAPATFPLPVSAPATGGWTLRASGTSPALQPAEHPSCSGTIFHQGGPGSHEGGPPGLRAGPDLLSD